MSKQIEERVLKVGFDNGQFESNVKTSMSTLEKLKRSLNFSGSAKGFEDISNAAKKVDMSSLSNAVDTVKVKFSALQVVAAAALANITTSVMRTGKNLTSSTIGQIMTGGKTRALNLEQARFQLQGLLNDAKQVEAIMGKGGPVQNAVSGTAYGLDEAAKVASQMVASGLKDTSKMEKALTAVSGVAAMTGASYSEIGHIFTTVSGNGKLMTNELRELSSRGLNAAAALADYLGKSEAEVRDMVTKGKIDFETFYTAMFDKFGEHAKAANDTFMGSMANAKAALSRIGADVYTVYLEKMKNVFNALRPVIDNIHTALGPLIDDINNVITKVSEFAVDKLNNIDLSPIAPAIEAIENIFRGLLSVLKPVKDAFAEVFPPVTAQQITGLAEKLRDLTAKFKISDETAEKIKTTFKGLFSVIDTGIQIIKNAANGIKNLIKNFAFDGSGFLNITSAIGKFFTKINDFIKEKNIIETVFNGISNVLSKAADGIKAAVSIISAAFEKLRSFAQSNLFEGLKKLAHSISNIFTRLFDAIGESLSKITLKTVGDFLGVVNKGIQTAIAAMIGSIALKKFINVIRGVVSDSTGFVGQIKNILTGVKDCLTAFQKDIKAKTLLKIAEAVGILAAALFVLSTISPDRLASGLGGITVLLGEVMGVMSVFEKFIKGDKLTGFGKAARAMIILSAAVLILSSAVSKLGNLDWDQLGKGLLGVTVLLGELTAVSMIMSKYSYDMIKASAGVIVFAAAILVLSQAVKKLGELNISELGKGLLGVGIIMTELAVFMKNTDLEQMGIRKATGILILAASIKVLASAVDSMGSLNFDQLLQGLLGVGTLLAELTLFLKYTGGAKHVISTAIGMTILGAAMKIFASAISDLGTMPIAELGKGLLAMAGALFIVAGAMNLMPKNIIISAVGLLAVSAALVVLSNALHNMGNMSWTEIAKGLVTLAGSLLIIAAAMAAMSGALAGAAALTIVSAALVVLSHALQSMGSMSWNEIAKSMVSLAGAFAILGVAAVVLTPIVPIIMLLGVAIAATGAGMLAAGAGILIFSAAITVLANAFSTSGKLIVDALKQIIELIPFFAQKLGEGIVEAAKAIGNCATEIIGVFKKIFSEMLKAVIELSPQISQTIGTLLSTILDLIVEKVPQMVDAGMKVILGFLQGIADNLGNIADAGMKMTIELINGMSDAIDDNAPAIGKAMQRLAQSMLTAFISVITGGKINLQKTGKDAGESVADGMEKSIPSVNNAGASIAQAGVEGVSSQSGAFNSIGSMLGNKLGSGINSQSGTVSSAGSSTASEGATGASAQSGAFNSIGSMLANKLGTGISSQSGTVLAAGSSTAQAGASGASSKTSAFQSIGSAMAQGLAAGITGGASTVISAVIGIASKAISAAKNALGINSPSKVFMAIGESVGEGMSLGIDNSTVGVVGSSIKMVSDLIKNTKSELDINSPSRVYMLIGEQIGEGLKIGIQNSVKSATEASSEMTQQIIEAAKKPFEEFEEWLEDRKYFNEIDTKLELFAWEQVIEQLQESTDEYKKAEKQIYSLYKDLKDISYDDLSDWVDNEKFYNRLTPEEELAFWQEHREDYIEGSEERKKIDKEIYSLRHELIDDSIGKLKEEIEIQNALIEASEEGSIERYNAEREKAHLTDKLKSAEFQNSKNWIEQEKYYNRLSLEEELQAWQRVQERYEEGTEERIEADKQVYSLKHELIDNNVNAIKAEMDYQRELRKEIDKTSEAYKNSIAESIHLGSTLVEQTKQYADEGDQSSILNVIGNLHKDMGEIAKEFGIDSEEFKKAAKDYNEAQQLLIYAKYQNSQNWMQNEIDWGRDTPLNKLAAQRRVLAQLIGDKKNYADQKEWKKRYESTLLIIHNLEKEIFDDYKDMQDEATKIKEDADKRRIELEEECADKIAEVRDKLAEDTKKLDDEYEERLKSRTDAIYKSWGLFDEVARKDNVSAETLRKNLEDQVNDLTLWRSTLSQLTDRGLDSGLVEELQEMGPTALAELQALNSMSDTELQQYANLWAKKHEEATKRATSELTDFRRETEEEIDALYEKAEQEIISWKNTYDGKLIDLRNDTDAALDDLQETFKKKIGIIREDTESQFAEMAEKANEYLRMGGWSKNGEDVWEQTGKYMVDGVITGIESERNNLLESLKETFNLTIEVSRKTVDENSPSKVYAEIGGYMIEGLIVGMEAYRNQLLDKTTDIGYTSIDAMRNALSGIADVVDTDLDYQPTIRPVIDFSDINSGVDRINGAFSADRSIRLASISRGIQNKNSAEDMASEIIASNERMNNRFTSAIDDIRSDISGLVDKVGRLQVVMDTGTLVGAITPEMDRSLGSLAVMNRRRSR